MLTRIYADRLITCDEENPDGTGPLGVIADAVVEWQGATLVAARRRRADESRAGHTVASLVTPGLIDAHTHAAWTGSRHDEYVMRMSGASYTDIAAAGGGIRSSQRAIANVALEDLTEALCARARRMAALGVTTLEVKSGYGLLPHLERKQLEAIARASVAPAMPTLVPTYLALHAIAGRGPGGEGEPIERREYVDMMVRSVAEVGAARLAGSVDAYIDAHAFSVEEADALFIAAERAGLRVRGHIGQFSDIGGAALLARHRALSADHLEHLDDAGARALADADVLAVLLPTACFTLGQTPPPVARMRAAGVRMVVASDANPGTAPTESLPLAMAMAARLYGLTVEEVLLGVTAHAARALDLGTSRGLLREGARADLAAWRLPHEAALIQPWGVAMTSAVISGGTVIAQTPRE
jgi:imidazolonepropionase